MAPFFFLDTAKKSNYYAQITNIVFEQNKFKEYQVLAKKYNTLNTTWADISKQKKVLADTFQRFSK